MRFKWIFLLLILDGVLNLLILVVIFAVFSMGNGSVW